jgi:hypothetical protein
MPSCIQIEGDPTTWWIDGQFPTSELTGGQPLTVTSLAPLEGTLVLSAKSATVVVLDAPSGNPPSPLNTPGAIIYVPTGTGPSAGHTGYVLAGDVGADTLSGQIAGAMHGGQSLTIALDDGGILVLNGATLTFAILFQPMAGGGTPHG